MISFRIIRAVALAVAISVGLDAAFAQQTAGPFTDLTAPARTAAELRAAELVELINANDPEETREYITNNFSERFRDAFPMQEHLDVFAEVYGVNGGFTIHGYRHYDPPRPESEAVLILRGRLSESWRAIVLSVEPESPHRIAMLNFAPARPPQELAEKGKLNEEQLVSELGAFVDRLANSDTFSGAVLLAKNGRVLYSKAHGLASKNYNVANKTDTKFNLGSMNKMFTGVAITQLAEKGMLSFDDPLSKHLSTDWLPREVADKIKIEHLLTHTSGLGSYFTPKFMNASRALYRNVDDYKPLVSDERPVFEPGTDWAYSNTGMLLLGAVIESVTGQSYHDYIREKITGPAGMINTDCYELDRVVPNLAVGYSRKSGPEGKGYYENNVFKHVIRGGPAGGGYSTVEDLLRFDQALRANKLVSEKSRERMWSPKPQSPDYGYGFGLRGTPGNRTVGHTGGFPGINSALEIHLDTGFTVAAMSNYDRGAMPIVDKINELLRRIE